MQALLNNTEVTVHLQMQAFTLQLQTFVAHNLNKKLYTFEFVLLSMSSQNVVLHYESIITQHHKKRSTGK